ncbi:MAG: hypothetical protein KC636_25610 [Myxococcales bacterium]|nr:hypothetical protein [Myxococcales bacterium]
MTPTSRSKKARLFEIASAQDGYFALSQAHEAGYSTQSVYYHAKVGNFQRVRNRIYRLTNYPPSERADLMILWLWSERRGVFSHSTALSLHELSDLLPERVHLTLPLTEQGRQRKTPPGLVLHYAEVPERERAWFGAVPVTSPRRTLLDCAADSLSPELLDQALEQAVARGLLDIETITEVAKMIAMLKGHTR